MKKTLPQCFNYFIAILFLLFSNSFVGQESTQKDSLTASFEKYKKHVLTLDYIGRKTNSNQYFLNLAKTVMITSLLKAVDGIRSKLNTSMSNGMIFPIVTSCFCCHSD